MAAEKQRLLTTSRPSASTNQLKRYEKQGEEGGAREKSGGAETLKEDARLADLDTNKATERRNMNKGPSRSSPPRRDFYGYGESQEPRRERSPFRSSPRRGSREPRDREPRTVRDGREPRDMREIREPRDMRDPRDLRDTRDRDMRDLRERRDRDFRDLRDSREARDSREYRDLHDPNPKDVRDRDVRVQDALFERYRDIRDPRDPLLRSDGVFDKYRIDEILRKKDDLYDRFRDPMDKFPEDRLKREERRREELYRQYFDDFQRKIDADRPVDCSVVVVNKQTKDYAESLGRKVRDLGLMVDLIFLNTEVSLAQALEDISRGGTPFAIVVTHQHQTHHSCTVNILFGTPQEHRNMPLTDAMVLVARSYERYKNETREKEREEIARQAAKLSAEAILRERGVDEGLRGSHPPGIMTLLALLADNRYITAEEIDKVIQYLQQRKERLLAMPGDLLTSQLSRPAGTSSLDTQSTHSGNQTIQQLTSSTSAAQTTSNTQQELQAKILSLFNSGSASATNTTISESTPTAPTPNYGSMSTSAVDTGPLGISQQRSQAPVSQHPNPMAPVAGVRAAIPRPGPAPQVQGLYGQLSNRMQAPVVPGQRPGASMGINFDNPSVQKALDTLIQSGPALSHLVSQTTGQGVRNAPLQQPSMAGYPRHF
ncbi:nuclear receptor coactivator 5 [Gastrophryne carolinensis]